MDGLIKRRRLLAVTAVLSLLLLTIISVGQLRWRAHLVFLQVTGQIRDIDLKQLIVYMMPTSDQSMSSLVEKRNPFAVIRNLKSAPPDIQAGSVLFREQCARCHAPDGSGGPGGPALIGRKFKSGDSDWAIYRAIQLGIPHTPTESDPLSDTQLWQLVGFIHSLDPSGRNIESPNDDATGKLEVAVPYEEIAAIREPAEDWLTFSGSYSSSRHSALQRINPDNVSQLALRWIHQFPSEPLEASPLVRSGVLFISAPAKTGRNHIQVVALDATNGRQLWTFDHELVDGTQGRQFGGVVNRGVAILNDKVFLGTQDARLIALSTATGSVQWDVAVANETQNYFISSAPLAYRDLVVTGVGTNRGGRAFVAAYDAKTGKERWRFRAIPEPGQHGNETWSGNSWREGGAPTWLTGSYDPELDLLYWTVGNPKPDYDAALRKGDNLYTNSVVALRGTTGELVWYFQFTPADDHDWDANQMPVLADYKLVNGTDRRLLLANRNGFYYVLDRVSGKFLNASPFVRQTWTDGLDSNGRPRPVATTRNREGVLLYPGAGGGTNWWPPSFDPALNLMFVPVLEQPMVYFSSLSSPPKENRARSYYTAIRALDATTGARMWEYRQDSPPLDNTMGGLLSTRTGIVFGGDQTLFFALDSRSGRLLWSVETGGMMKAAPVTYEVNKEQFVAIAGGQNLMVFSLPTVATYRQQKQ